MLDDFDQGRRVEAGEAVVSVEQRALNEVDTDALARGHLVEVQALGGVSQGLVRYVHTEDVLDFKLAQKQPQQFAFAAAQVEHALGGQVVDFLGYLLQALVVEGEFVVAFRIHLTPRPPLPRRGGA